MNISLYSDAPKHNLALMKISAWHKANGDSVCYNLPIMGYDKSYASILYEKNINMFIADEYGGPAFPGSCLPASIEAMYPDYELYSINYSLGYTFRPCYRGCSFCKVKDMAHPDHDHHSIFEFYNKKFKHICLLNNNTFMDRRWRETFEEIWSENLIVIDENGYDLRLMDEEKAAYLKKTKFKGKIHYAWDRMDDENKILAGLKVAPKGTVYVLIGYDTTTEQDFHRCQKIVDHGFDPYIMPYNQSRKEKRFKRFMDSFMWRKYKTLKEAWLNYNA